MSCAFCAVVAGAVPARVVLDEEHVVAFLDHRPVFKGHVLLVPRPHVDTLTELPDALVVPLFTATRRLAAAVRSGLGAQGSFVAMNNTVSQSVAHLHVHVVPRTKGDGLRGFFWPRTTYRSADEAADYAARLSSALRDDADTTVTAEGETGAPAAPPPPAPLPGEAPPAAPPRPEKSPPLAR